MDSYPLIAEHGLVGDLQTAALVSTDGTVDWFCSPRFDSPSVFGALLDRQRGGHCRIRPAVPAFTVRQLYFPDTAILITRFMTDAGTGEVVDFMVPSPRGQPTEQPPAVPHAAVRARAARLPGGGGAPVRLRPASTSDTRDRARRGVRQRRRRHDRCTPSGNPATSALADLRVTDDGDVRGSVTLTAGQVRGIVLETGGAGPRTVRVGEVEERLRRHGPVLALLAGALDLPGPVAGDTATGPR